MRRASHMELDWDQTVCARRQKCDNRDVMSWLWVDKGAHHLTFPHLTVGVRVWLQPYMICVELVFQVGVPGLEPVVGRVVRWSRSWLTGTYA